VSESAGVGAPEAAGAGGSGGAGGAGGAGAAGGYLSHRQVMIVLPGLILTMVLAMLDQLVVSTALPRIVGDLGGVSHLSWVVTAYILTSTITTPFYGKLGDMYGRKKLFIFAIVLFLIGSALSGLSTSMAMLISFRALQGLGAGGLMVGAMATLGEIVPPRERGKYMSYFMAAMMLATVGGPLLGLQQGTGVRQERLAVRGEPDAARGAAEQPHAQVPLQAGDALGDGLLGDRQLGGGLGKLPGVADGDERADGLEIHANRP